VGSVFAEEEDTRNKNLLLKRERRRERRDYHLQFFLVFFFSLATNTAEKREREMRDYISPRCLRTKKNILESVFWLKIFPVVFWKIFIKNTSKFK